MSMFPGPKYSCIPHMSPVADVVGFTTSTLLVSMTVSTFLQNNGVAIIGEGRASPRQYIFFFHVHQFSLVLVGQEFML